MRSLFVLLIMMISSYTLAQTRVGGKVVDQNQEPIPFATVVFKGSTIGVITDEHGKFYLSSEENHQLLEVSFVGYTPKSILIENQTQSAKQAMLNLQVMLKEETDMLDEVVVYSGKRKNKGNPAVDLLRKVWANKRKNGLKAYPQYQFDKYEKIQFDLNNIDSSIVKSKVFKNMEFIFDQMDTSKISGKTFLPIFINEAIYKVYGTNDPSRYKEDLQANKNSGFESNQFIIAYAKDLYTSYDIQDAYINLFDKKFVSPVARSGLATYNYVLSDSAYVDGVWAYNVVFYPRRKGEMTFKGDFWITDKTFAIKDIEMTASKSANLNWVKDLYIAQSFDVLNDSVVLLKRDHITTDFSFRKKEESKGVYGKRTTLYGDYIFDSIKPTSFYARRSDNYATEIYTKDDVYWNLNRMEDLSDGEEGIYSMLDTLSKVKRFQNIFTLMSIAASDYVEFNGFDIGPLSATLGRNDVEGLRFRFGARTYFGPNDPWRIQAYTAYGTEDQKFKYAVAGKWLLNKQNRLKLSLGYLNDVQQIGVSLTESYNVMGNNVLSSAFFSIGAADKLSSVKMFTGSASIEPKKNLQFRLGATYRDIVSASETFNLDWYDEQGEVQSRTRQAEWDVGLIFTPSRKTIGNGVEILDVDDNAYPTIYLGYARGYKGFYKGDFDYNKYQLYYNQPWIIGGFGRMFATLELGKIDGQVPLALMNVVPGNQSFVIIDNTFSLMDYYEFITDTYASLRVEHNFGGRILGRIPLLKQLQLREVIGVKTVYGTISDENRAINASDIPYRNPDPAYYEYSFGIDNIFKFLRVDYIRRGNYLNVPGARKWGLQIIFDAHF